MAQNGIFCRLRFSFMVIETEDHFNHGIKGERQAGESLLAKASVTDFKFPRNLILHMAKSRIPLPSSFRLNPPAVLACQEGCARNYLVVGYGTWPCARSSFLNLKSVTLALASRDSPACLSLLIPWLKSSSVSITMKEKQSLQIIPFWAYHKTPGTGMRFYCV